MQLHEWKENVLDANLELVHRGLVLYTWGNASAIDRERGLVIIKPRGVEYDQLTADDMSVVDLDGNQVEGDLLPSVDLDIHLALYRQFQEIGGIAHTHSTYATSYYNKFWLEAQHPAGLLPVSCLSYNKGSNWLTNTSLGFHVRCKDCQLSPCCSVRFKQVEPKSSCHPID